MSLAVFLRFSIRYGTLPVVRETGGLADSVKPYNQFTGEGNGFSFMGSKRRRNGRYYFGTLLTYTRTISNRGQILEKQAMAEDFSWHNAANEYLDVYHLLP